MRCSRSTPWHLAGEVPLTFDAHHPQGMVRVGASWWISTVDITTTTGWLLHVTSTGELVERVAVGDEVRFHPGGIDYDGRSLWVASSEYRPRSTAVIERVDLDPPPGQSPAAQPQFAVDDHIGGVVRLGPGGDVIGWTWGSRRFRRWTTSGTLVAEVRHPSHFVDYQDGQWIGDDLIVCGGVATVEVAQGKVSLGGLGVVRSSDLAVVVETPFPGHSSVTGRAATQNPIFVEAAGEELVVHVLPDDGFGRILSFVTPLVQA